MWEKGCNFACLSKMIYPMPVVILVVANSSLVASELVLAGPEDAGAEPSLRPEPAPERACSREPSLHTAAAS